MIINLNVFIFIKAYKYKRKEMLISNPNGNYEPVFQNIH